jgi:GNAT superfamily N-acetyltransferase
MHVRNATAADAEAVFALVNASYHVETGDVPPAFKKTTRFIHLSEVLPNIVAGRVLLCEVPGGAPLGCLSYTVERGEAVDAPLRAHFGPFAVAPEAQGRGVGSCLLSALERQARALGCASLDAEVVNHRHDLFHMYFGMGFRVVGEGAFPAPERTSRPCHFVCIRRALPAEVR